jgi:hypothetical protein
LDQKLEELLSNIPRYNLRIRTTAQAAIEGPIEVPIAPPFSNLSTRPLLLTNPGSIGHVPSPPLAKTDASYPGRTKGELLPINNKKLVRFSEIDKGETRGRNRFDHRETRDLARVRQCAESCEEPSYLKQSLNDLLAKKKGAKSSLHYANLSTIIEYFSDIPDVEVIPEEWCNAAITTDPRIPKSVKQALKGPEAEKWAEAIKSEMESIEHHDTYTWEHLPAGKRALRCGLILRIKPAADGKPERFKARLVAYGNQQREGEDFIFEELFAPVVKYKTLRLICALAAQYNLHLHKLDVKTAFLNGEIDEEVYLYPPQGTRAPYGHRGKVWRVRKSLYGLRQAPRAWNNQIHAFLLTLGFRRVESDYGLYVKGRGENIELVSVYVDDILVAAKRIEAVTAIKDALKKKFDMSDFGEAKTILGINIRRNFEKGELILEQSEYIQNLLSKFRQQNSQYAVTPIDRSLPALSKSHCPISENEKSAMADKPYREVVGSLMHLMVCTRPDIAHAVSTLSRFLQNPGAYHWDSAIRVLQYLHKTKRVGLKYQRTRDNPTIIGDLRGYCDSDWAGDKDNYLSTAGWVFMMNGGAISWQCKRGKTPAQSSCDAEYVAEGLAGQEICHLRNLLSELHLEPQDPIPLFSDSKSAIAITNNPVFHERSKHVALKFHFSRHLQADGRMKLQYVSTDRQVADALTKPLFGPKMKWSRDNLGLVTWDDPHHGGC